MIYSPYMYAQSMQPNDFRIITVRGAGEIFVEPDEAIVQLSVLTENPELTVAQRENATTMTRVINTLEELGIPNACLQTTVFYIQPHYDYVDGKKVFRTYEVKNTISVRITNFNSVGRVIDASVENGVNEVGNITFSRSDVQQLKQRTLQLALQDAHKKAQAMIETLHIPLNNVPIKITEIEQEQPSFCQAQTFSLTEQVTTTPIEKGQIMVRSAVLVQYSY